MPEGLEAVGAEHDAPPQLRSWLRAGQTGREERVGNAETSVAPRREDVVAEGRAADVVAEVRRHVRDRGAPVRRCRGHLDRGRPGCTTVPRACPERVDERADGSDT